MSKLLPLMVYPLGLAFSLVIVAILFWRWVPRLARLMMLIAVIQLYVASTPWFAEMIAGSLEAQNPPQKISSLPNADIIVVLGGGINGIAKPRLSPELNDAADRLWYAAKLYKAYKAQWVLLTGGQTPWSGVMSPEAQSMSELIQQWGVAGRALKLEGKSRNTYENAVNSRFLIPIENSHILLVTSAMHMPRAKAAFQKQGFIVTAATTDIQVTQHPTTILDYLPSADALALTTQAVKEHLGILYYRSQGWID
ncbi:MAG: YdcF family protein [bacterium]